MTYKTKLNKEIPCHDERTRDILAYIEGKYPDYTLDYFAGTYLLVDGDRAFNLSIIDGYEIGSEQFLKAAGDRFLPLKAIQKNIAIESPPVKIEHYQNDYGEFIRPTMETAYMSLASIMAARSTCLGKKVGAVITDRDMTRVLCVGYNGSYSGGPNQCDNLQPGVCGCLHAEINAILKNVGDLKQSVLFVTLSPCYNCSKILLNVGIGRVVYLEEYRNSNGIDLLRSNAVIVQKYSNL